ncbi:MULTISPECIES: hypothetical protein [unclassified Isoptericola]|nr:MULTISPECIES: hypothetical protein [unclassified Isoptericola]MDO8143877.1 hypothetical protein [Isoptericola sp. 178]MDO8149301.1 hypothetical protein [Isoptericola sp. b515]MDO8152240.1 hypothetical protein [Isoptericola sp. b408]
MDRSPGTWHEDGDPTCVVRPDGGGVRFAWERADVEDVSWRVVVLVDCRS